MRCRAVSRRADCRRRCRSVPCRCRRVKATLLSGTQPSCATRPLRRRITATVADTGVDGGAGTNVAKVAWGQRWRAGGLHLLTPGFLGSVASVNWRPLRFILQWPMGALTDSSPDIFGASDSSTSTIQVLVVLDSDWPAARLGSLR